MMSGNEMRVAAAVTDGYGALGALFCFPLPSPTLSSTQARKSRPYFSSTRSGASSREGDDGRLDVSVRPSDEAILSLGECGTVGAP